MVFRSLGRTGFRVSEIGLGCEHLQECLACGACEKRCPFQVPVIERMRRAEAVFGT